jgi:hypothetical protein
VPTWKARGSEFKHQYHQKKGDIFMM